MIKFKKGDRVICYKEHKYSKSIHFSIGHIFEVEKFDKSVVAIPENGYDRIFIKYSSNMDDHGNFRYNLVHRHNCFYDYFMSEAEYRKMKIDKLLE